MLVSGRIHFIPFSTQPRARCPREWSSTSSSPYAPLQYCRPPNTVLEESLRSGYKKVSPSLLPRSTARNINNLTQENEKENWRVSKSHRRFVFLKNLYTGGTGFCKQRRQRKQRKQRVARRKSIPGPGIEPMTCRYKQSETSHDKPHTYLIGENNWNETRH